MNEKNICFVTSNLKNPDSEGAQKTFYNIASEFMINKKNKIISLFGESLFDEHYIVNSNPFFINSKIRKILSHDRVDTIFYMPSQSLTLSTILRIVMLKIFSPRSHFLIFLIQYNYPSFASTNIARFIFKSSNFTLITSSYRFQNKFRLSDNNFLNLGVNSEKFRPVTDNTKKKLRKKYDLDTERILYLHVGHYTKLRGLEDLIFIKKHISNSEVIIILSDFKKVNKSHIDHLEKSGIKVIHKYLENINEFYQMSDFYIFPVRSELSSIGFPLSVVESLACGVPVFSFRNETLEKKSISNKILFYNNTKELNNIILNYEQSSSFITYDYTWKSVSRKVKKLIYK